MRPIARATCRSATGWPAVQHAPAHADFDRLRRSDARSEMACARGHASRRRRQGSETLSHIGDDRIAHAARALRARGATPAQTNVGIQFAFGKMKPAIADELGIQLSSVMATTQKLYQNLDVHNSAELATKIWLDQKSKFAPHRISSPLLALPANAASEIHHAPVFSPWSGYLTACRHFAR